MDRKSFVESFPGDINRELLTSYHGRLQEIIKPKLSETIENKLPSLADESQITNVEDLEVEVIQEVLVDVVNSTVKTETGINGITKLQKPKLSNSSMIKIVGIQDKRTTSQISLSKPLQTKTSYTTFDMPSPYHIDTAPRRLGSATLWTL